MSQTDLQCPCMPMCPNYGKCRQCIAAHAAYYTVPKCVKIMQEDMKKNHHHPSNPHVRKTLPERVAEFYRREPDAHLRTAAEALNITHWQLLDAMENAVSVPLSDLDGIYDELTALPGVMLHVDTGSAVIQLTTALPQAREHGDTKVITCRGGDVGLTALLFPKALYALFLVREQLLGGKESLSLALVGEDEGIALSIYLRRSGENTIEERSKALFEALWKKYSKSQE